MRMIKTIDEKLRECNSEFISGGINRYSYRELLDPYSSEYKDTADKERIDILKELKRCNISMKQVISEYTQRYSNREDITSLIPMALPHLIDILLGDSSEQTNLLDIEAIRKVLKLNTAKDLVSIDELVALLTTYSKNNSYEESNFLMNEFSLEVIHPDNRVKENNRLSLFYYWECHKYQVYTIYYDYSKGSFDLYSVENKRLLKEYGHDLKQLFRDIRIEAMKERYQFLVNDSNPNQLIEKYTGSVTFNQIAKITKSRIGE